MTKEEDEQELKEIKAEYWNVMRASHQAEAEISQAEVRLHNWKQEYFSCTLRLKNLSKRICQLGARIKDGM